MERSTVCFCYEIDPLWEILKKIRDKVESSLEPYGRSLMDAGKMTASELVENAIKYGSSVDKDNGITFEFTADSHQIRITVTNRIHSDEDYQFLKDRIDRITASDDAQTLYVSRLRELMEDAKISRTQLGLYRISYEGKFELSYKFENQIVTVIATRKV